MAELCERNEDIHRDLVELLIEYIKKTRCQIWAYINLLLRDISNSLIFLMKQEDWKEESSGNL